MGRLFKSLSDVTSELKKHGFVRGRNTKTAALWTHPDSNRRVSVPLRESNSRSYLNMIRVAYRDAGIPYSDKEKQREDKELGEEKLTFRPGTCEDIKLDGETPTFGWRFMLTDFGARTQATPLSADREISKAERLTIAGFANRHSVNAACKQYSVKKKHVNQWRLELQTQERTDKALETVTSKRYSFQVPLTSFALVYEPWLTRNARESIVRKRCHPAFASVPPAVRQALPAVEPEVVVKVRYMLSQGVAVASVASLYGLGPAVVELLAQSDTEPSGLADEDLQARVDRLESENQKLREELAALKRKFKI